MAIETSDATSATTERSEIQFGLTRIPFQIRRSDKRETVALTIEMGGKLVVTAPTRTPIDKLNAVVRNKGFWVVQRLRRASERPPPPSEREFATGETVLYLGRHYRLRVVEKDEVLDPDDDPRFRGGWYEVAVPARLQEPARRTEVRRRLLGSLKQHAELYLQGRLGYVCDRLQLEKPSMIVRAQRRRWGSCDAAGVLRINWRIVQAPISLIDYVLVHELAHLRFASHGPEFWGLLERWMPEYEGRRRRLRELGAALEW